MTVLVLHTVPPEIVSPGRRPWEFDVGAAACSVAAVVPGAIVASVRGEAPEILALLETHRPDVVFNLCEAPLGRPDLEPHVAALFEWIGVRFTGSGSETLALCRRKDRARAILAEAGVPIARAEVFPCIVKPADEDGSAWIDGDSICEDMPALLRARSRLPGPVVVEEFLPGREFAVSLWGRTDPDYLSIGETRFAGGLRVNTYAAKWDVESPDFASSPLSYEIDLAPSLREAVIAAAAGAWRAVGARGYLRVDVRFDATERPRVLDVNPNPELSPGVGIHRAVEESGWSWADFARQQVAWA